MITSSPSSRNLRLSPVGSVSGSVPRQVSSSRQPRASFVGAGDRAAGEQIAGPEVAAVAGVVGQHLRRGSSTGRPSGSRLSRTGAHALAPASARCAASTSSVTSTPPALAFVSTVEVGQRRGVARRAREGRDPERRQRLERHHPGRDRGREALGQERAERLVLPRLDVARRPVVHQAEPEQVLLRLARSGPARPAGCPARRSSRPPSRSRATGSGRRPAARRAAAWSGPAAAAPACRSARSTTRGRDSRSAPTCSSAAADCRAGTCCRRWWRGGPRRRNRCSRRSAAGSSSSASAMRHEEPVAEARVARGTPRESARAGRLTCCAERAQCGRAQRHQRVERGGRAGLSRPLRRSPLKQPASCAAGQVEDLVADRHADAAARLRRRRREDAERQVLDGEVGVAVGRLHPGAASGSWVWSTPRAGHRRWSASRSPIGSVKEQEPNDPSPPRRAWSSAADLEAVTTPGDAAADRTRSRRDRLPPADVRPRRRSSPGAGTPRRGRG